MFGTGLVKYLPSPIRQALATAAQIFIRRKFPNIQNFRPLKQFGGQHVAVAGLFSTRTGLGRAAELVALTLESRGHRITRVDITEVLGVPSARTTALSLRSPAECNGMDVSDVVFVINPDQDITLAFDQNWLIERCVIGHWIWEIEALPRIWSRAVASFDEIWAPTELVRDIILNGVQNLKRPVRVVPYGIELDPMPQTDPAQRANVRARLQIGDSLFVAGYSFAVDSNYYRKNPEDAVRAFRRAFPAGDHSVRLLLRSNDFSKRPNEYQRLKTLIGDDCRVQILGADDRIGIIDFYAALDVFISTSRAEGYGLNLVEAAQSGLPVITCGWRITPEILRLPGVRATRYQIVKVDDPQGHYDKIVGAVWAAPDISEMAAILAGDRSRIRRASGLAGFTVRT